MGLEVGRAQPETGLEGRRDQIRIPGDDPGGAGEVPHSGGLGKEGTGWSHHPGGVTIPGRV